MIKKDLKTAESRLELKLPSFKAPPPPPPGRGRGKGRGRGQGKRVGARQAAGRRYGYQDWAAGAGEQQRQGGSSIFPIPVEFLNQLGAPPQGAFRPGQEEAARFNPSAQIETIVKGVSTVVTEPSAATQADSFNFITEAVPGRSSPAARSVSPESIYREEFPVPGPAGRPAPGPPYPQVPYHDARLSTPGPQQAGGQVLHYVAPPNQVKPAVRLDMLDTEVTRGTENMLNICTTLKSWKTDGGEDLESDIDRLPCSPD